MIGKILKIHFVSTIPIPSGHFVLRPFSVFPRPVLLDTILSHCISFVGEGYCPGLGPGVQVAKQFLTPYPNTCSGYWRILKGVFRVDPMQLFLQFEMFSAEAVIGVARDLDKRYTCINCLGKISTFNRM